MVKIALQLKVNLENLTSLKADGDDFRWYLKLKCLNCGEETKSHVYFTILDSVPLKGGRGSACLVSKCKLCSRENSIDIVKDSLQAYQVNEGSFQSIVAFECRGVEPTDFSPRTGWSADSKFAVDLTEGEWCDYDENAQQSVGVYEIEHKFIKI